MSSDQNIKNSEQFRDQISTVDKSGKRVWIYPKKPSGKFWSSIHKSEWRAIHPNKYSGKKFYFVWIAFWPAGLLSVCYRHAYLFSIYHTFYSSIW